MTNLIGHHSRSRTLPEFDALEIRDLLSIGIPGDGSLDITFIGDKYTDMGQFHNDVQTVVNALLSYQPFQSRADQIHIHEIDNTVSLGSTRSSGMDRLLTVDEGKTDSLVIASGVPTDVIGVLVNDPGYGGSGGIVAVSYNGPMMGDVFVHEFGHSFGQLYDEYSYGTTGPLDGQVHSLQYGSAQGNVYAGLPPAAAWSGLVAPDEYFLGAGCDNWYRSSLNSEMGSVGGTVFDAVSQLMLESQINYWAGPSSDHQAPSAAIVGLHDGDSVSGVVPVATNLTDNQSVIIAELWVDGQLARTCWQAPFTLDWTTGHEAIGTHTLFVRALDASGNVGDSSPIHVNLTGGADIQIVSPANNATIAGNMFPLQLSMWPQGSDQVSVQVDGSQVMWFDPSRSGTQTTIFLATPLSPGAHTLTVVASVSNPDPAHHLERYRTSITLTSNSNSSGISFRSPQFGSTVHGVVALAVNATSGALKRVQYFVDASPIKTSTKAPFGVTWNTRKVKDGVHVLRAVALDAAGVTRTAVEVVTVKNLVDRKAPAVTIAQPGNNAKLSSGVVAITGKARDNVAVANVSLYIDNNFVAVSAIPNFTWVRDLATLAPGKHKIRVRDRQLREHRVVEDRDGATEPAVGIERTKNMDWSSDGLAEGAKLAVR